MLTLKRDKKSYSKAWTGESGEDPMISDHTGMITLRAIALK